MRCPEVNFEFSTNQKNDGCCRRSTVQEKRVNELPISWVDGPDRQLAVGTKPGLKYDIEELSLKRGEKIALTFNNNDDMLHNLVVTTKGPDTADKVGNMALQLGLDGADLNYVPDSDMVIVHTGILQPESSETIYFQTFHVKQVNLLDCLYFSRTCRFYEDKINCKISRRIPNIYFATKRHAAYRNK